MDTIKDVQEWLAEEKKNWEQVFMRIEVLKRDPALRDSPDVATMEEASMNVYNAVLHIQEVLEQEIAKRRQQTEENV